MELEDMADAVETEAEFLAFAQALLEDWNEEEERLAATPVNEHYGLRWRWANGDIGGFSTP